MPNNDQLSDTMAEVLGETMAHGGRLERHVGGYWTWPDCPRLGGQWAWYAGTSTIEALVKRGYMAYTKHRRGRLGDFPIEATLTAKTISIP